MDHVSYVTKVNNGICSVEKVVTWIAFSIMLALLIIQVIFRYCLNWPLAWAEEMVRYTYIAVSFIGATVAVRENSHISINILPNILNALIKNNQKRIIVQDGIDILAALIVMVFWAVMFLWMLRYNLDIAEHGQITTANEWPMWLMCLPVTVSSALMGLQSALNAVEKGIEIYSLRKGGTNS
jgi:C4-dicarboxylate transporter DctQ subunit